MIRVGPRDIRDMLEAGCDTDLPMISTQLKGGVHDMLEAGCIRHGLAHDQHAIEGGRA